MSKRVAVLAVNPVNGYGLFNYLEAFFEKGVSYTLFAVADDINIRTNSGVLLRADGLVADLKGHADEFDALVFSCGDAVPIFRENAERQFNKDLLSVIKEFDSRHKILVGHCAAGLIFEIADVTKGKCIAVHPLAKPAIQKGITTDEASVIDSNLYTAECEHAILLFLPTLLKALA